MNRLQEISAAILNALCDWEAPANEVVIHAQVNDNVQPEALQSEFRDAINFLDESGFITGVRNPIKGTRWSITDKGRAARHS